MGSPSQLFNRGWKPKALKAGDKVVVVIHPMRDGSNGGVFVSGDGRGREAAWQLICADNEYWLVKVANVFLLLAAMPFMGTVHAAANSVERVHAFAQLPDWTGIWLNSAWLANESGRPPGGTAQVRATAQLLRPPPYNTEWAAKFDAGMKDTAALAARSAVEKVCLRTYPALMEGPRMFQVAIQPEETLLVFESGQVRHVYTDGRSHPPADELWETPLGDSVGHWERDVLVIDTIARPSSQPVTVNAWLSLLSEDAHFTERFRLVDPDTLENQVTIEGRGQVGEAMARYADL